MKMIKIIAVAVLLTAFCSLSHAWDNNVVHPALTNKAVDFLLAEDPANFDDLKNVSHFNIEDHRGKQLTFIDEGSVKEDFGLTPLCEFECSTPSWIINKFGEKQDVNAYPLAWKEHGYNPVTGHTFFYADVVSEALADYLAENYPDIKLTKIANAMAEAEAIWIKLNEDEVTNKYFHIGRISHLIEDMASPAHAHAVSHVNGEDVETFGEENYDATVFSVSAARRPSDSGRDTMNEDNAGNFMKNVAWNTYYMTGYQGELVAEAGAVQPDSELKRMFPDLRYDDGGWALSSVWSNGWMIPDVGKYYRYADILGAVAGTFFKYVPGTSLPSTVLTGTLREQFCDWWECDSDAGYYYIRHTADAKPKVFKKDKFKRILSGDDLNAALENNATNKELTAIYTENLFQMAAEWVAGFIAFAYEVENRLRLIYPNGGEYLQYTDTVDVRWNYTGTAIKTVTLEILKDNAVLVTKVGLNPATAFSLLIKRDIPNVKGSSTYQIRIIGKAADGGEVTRDMSSAFSVFNSDDLTTPIPSISPPSGTYFPGQSVSIRKAGAMMQIRYTTDGTAPTESNGYDYSVPFTISEPVTIKAIATYGVAKSAAVEAVYTIKLRAPAISYTPPSSDVTFTSIAGASIRYTAKSVGKIDDFALLDAPTTSTGTEYSAPFSVSGTSLLKAVAYKDGFTTSDAGDYEVLIPLPIVPVISDYDGDGVSDTDELEVFHTDPTVAGGDVDGNGKVELADAVLALKIMAGITISPPQTVKLGADVNGDGKIGMAEVVYILAHLR